MFTDQEDTLERKHRPYTVWIDENTKLSISHNVDNWCAENFGKAAYDLGKRNGRWFWLYRSEWQRYRFTFKTKSEALYFWMVWG